MKFFGHSFWILAWGKEGERDTHHILVYGSLMGFLLPVLLQVETKLTNGSEHVVDVDMKSEERNVTLFMASNAGEGL